MQDEVLVKITRVTDDSTGMYEAGEFDFSIPALAMERFLSDPGNRERLAANLRWHADACEAGHPPYGDRPRPGEEEAAKEDR